MADESKETPKVDKVTGAEYTKTRSPLFSKKALIIVAGVVVLEAVLITALMSLAGGKSQAKEPEDGADDPAAVAGPVLDPLYRIGSAKATVKYANGSRMVVVGVVSIALDEKKAPKLKALLEDEAHSDDFKIPAVVVIEDLLRTFDYEQLQQKGIKEKLEMMLPAMIETKLGLEAGTIKTIHLQDFQLPK